MMRTAFSIFSALALMVGTAALADTGVPYRPAAAPAAATLKPLDDLHAEIASASPQVDVAMLSTKKVTLYLLSTRQRWSVDASNQWVYDDASVQADGSLDFNLFNVGPLLLAKVQSYGAGDESPSAPAPVVECGPLQLRPEGLRTKSPYGDADWVFRQVEDVKNKLRLLVGEKLDRPAKLQDGTYSCEYAISPEYGGVEYDRYPVGISDPTRCAIDYLVSLPY